MKFVLLAVLVAGAISAPAKQQPTGVVTSAGNGNGNNRNMGGWNNNGQNGEKGGFPWNNNNGGFVPGSGYGNNGHMGGWNNNGQNGQNGGFPGNNYNGGIPNEAGQFGQVGGIPDFLQKVSNEARQEFMTISTNMDKRWSEVETDMSNWAEKNNVKASYDTFVRDFEAKKADLNSAIAAFQKLQAIEKNKELTGKQIEEQSKAIFDGLSDRVETALGSLIRIFRPNEPERTFPGNNGNTGFPGNNNNNNNGGFNGNNGNNGGFPGGFPGNNRNMGVWNKNGQNGQNGGFPWNQNNGGFPNQGTNNNNNRGNGVFGK